MSVTDEQRSWYYQKGLHGEILNKTGIPDLDESYRRGQVHRKASNRQKTSLREKADLFTHSPLSSIDVVAAHGIPLLLKLCWNIIILPFKLIAWIFLMLFIRTPLFLWHKGKAGRITLLVIIGTLGILITVQQIRQRFFNENKTISIIAENKTYAHTKESELNIRSAPSSESEILGIIPSNTQLIIIEIVEGRNWAKIKYYDKEGYVNLDFIIKDEQN